MNFIEQTIKRAKSNLKTIVLPETTDKRVLEAAHIIHTQKIAKVVLVGDEHKIKELFSNIRTTDMEIVNSFDSDISRKYAEEFYELRKKKGITLDEARKIVSDPLYFGTMMVKCDDADGMVAGAINSTSNTLRPALQILKTAPNVKLVSSFFVMSVPNCEYGHDGVFIYSDCGLKEDPDAEQLADIAIIAAKSFEHLVGELPKVAMLSYSTYGSAKSELTEKVAKATEIAKKAAPELILDGEMQVDAAIVPAVCNLKAPGSILGGRANVLIFPDLNSGNIAYKLTERLAKASAFGPITQGLARPVNDISRGCSAEDIVGVVAITSVQAQK